MVKSFRLRLAVSTALLAGVALAGFAAIAWWQMRDAKIGTLERQIRDQAEREISRRWPADQWTRHEYNMGRVFGTHTVQQSLLLVQDSQGMVFRSKHWPENLAPDKLPWPQQENRPEPLEPDDSGASNVADPPPDGMEPSNIQPPPGMDAQEQPLPPPENLTGGLSPPLGPPPRPRLPAFTVISLESGGKHWRLGLASTPREKLAIGVDLAVVEAEMTEMRNAFLLAAPLALGFISLGAWFLSGRALSPIRSLTATMESVTAKGLDQHVALRHEDEEFRRLIQVFNGMLERLERSFLQATRFSGDAAHELKTPLAILQGQIERAMAQCEAGSPIQTHLTDILDEVQRLGTISRKLLILSLADAGRLRLHVIRLDLSQVLADLLEDAEMLAPELVVSGSIAPGLMVKADAALLQQVLHNLLGNAIKYNLPNGWIRISASLEGGRVKVSIVNSSAGIPPADHERIFERFYRADPAHNRQVEGVGLGLSLSREIVQAHGGDLVLADSGEGEVRFVVSLAV